MGKAGFLLVVPLIPAIQPTKTSPRWLCFDQRSTASTAAVQKLSWPLLYPLLPRTLKHTAYASWLVVYPAAHVGEDAGRAVQGAIWAWSLR